MLNIVRKMMLAYVNVIILNFCKLDLNYIDINQN